MPAPPLPDRAALAAQAARRAAAHQTAAPLLPALCRLTTAELLAAPPGAPRPADLAAELAALCAAAEDAVRRRPGWLIVRPGGGPLPVAVPVRLLQAAVLGVWAAALRTGASAAAGWGRDGGGAVLWAAGGRPGAGQAALLPRLAAVCGGVLLQTARPPFTAVWRLPCADRPTKTASRAEELLADRYSLLYQYLAGFCAGPEA